MKFELSNNFKERLKVEIENQNVKFIKSAFHEVSHVDVAELLYEFNSLESKYVLDNIGLETSSKIISELDDDTRENFLGDEITRSFDVVIKPDVSYLEVPYANLKDGANYIDNGNVVLSSSYRGAFFIYSL